MALQICTNDGSVKCYVFYTPIAKVLDERDEYIRKNLTEASETLAKAEAITKQYEQDLALKKDEMHK